MAQNSATYLQRYGDDFQVGEVLEHCCEVHGQETMITQHLMRQSHHMLGTQRCCPCSLGIMACTLSIRAQWDKVGKIAATFFGWQMIHKWLAAALACQVYDCIACLQGCHGTHSAQRARNHCDWVFVQAANYCRACVLDAHISCAQDAAESCNSVQCQPLHVSNFFEQTCRNSSADRAPLVPELKLSMYLTHRLSRGTVVPPAVTTATLWQAEVVRLA